MKKKFLCLLTLYALFSCSDPIEPSLEQDAENFELFDFDNGQSNEEFILGLEVIGDKLFFLHTNFPGFIDKQHRAAPLCCLTSDLNNRFKPSFTENYIIHPIEDLNGLVVFPVVPGELRTIIFDELLGDEWKGARLVTGFQKEHFHSEKNFDLNGNHLILNLQKDGNLAILILEINFGTGFHQLELKQVTEIGNLGLESHSNSGLIIQSIKKYEDRWIAHIRSTGNGMGEGNSYLISKDGGTEKLPGPTLGSTNFRFYDFAKLGPQEYLITESPIGRISYGSSPVSENKAYITEINGPLVIRSDGQKGLIFIPGTNVIASIENFRENGISNHQLKQLDNTGIANDQIYDAQFFENKVYIATKSGLFVKSQENFWEEIRLP
ncbi:hypothetical protein [Cecembia rubra]|uniref:Uncharacterized protein n=1 Tax=Cecembia rubra TaxID=1485585 RepID=A0A2P8DW74_9BACT|nr:hypothetical protein [Cecembia rubra]PSL01468.1 hypothetical protein CLV48_11362 [Cecembia rubra]